MSEFICTWIFSLVLSMLLPQVSHLKQEIQHNAPKPVYRISAMQWHELTSPSSLAPIFAQISISHHNTRRNPKPWNYLFYTQNGVRSFSPIAFQLHSKHKKSRASKFVKTLKPLFLRTAVEGTWTPTQKPGLDP
jgi:hypothetical protein